MPEEALLVFDGDCGFCTWAARWAEKRFRHGERAASWQELGEEKLASLGLGLQDAARSAWWVEVDGARERGHRAVGRALRAGGGWRGLAGQVVLVPPTSLIAALLYRAVARWRHRLPGATPACRLDPERRSTGAGGGPAGPE